MFVKTFPKTTVMFSAEEFKFVLRLAENATVAVSVKNQKNKNHVPNKS